MHQHSVNFLVIAALGAFAGCHSSTKNQGTAKTPDTNTTTPPNTTTPAATTYTANLLVVNINGQPLADATLSIAGETFLANSDGRIEAPDLSTTGVQLGSVASPNYLTIPVSLSAYAPGAALRTVVLKHPQLVTQFAAGSPATIDLHAHFIALSPNSFVDGSGQPYTGTVQVQASAFDPTTEVFQTYNGSTSFALRSDFSTESIPSGAFTVVAADGNVLTGPPEGYVNLNATDDAGEPLSLASDTPAVVHIALTPFTVHQVGDILPLMSFNASQATWVQEGTCTVLPVPPARNMPGRLECVGVVKHFSAVGVPSAGVTTGAPCTNFVPQYNGFSPTNVRMSVESALNPASAFSPAQNQALTRDGAQCYIGGPSVARLLVYATVNGVEEVLGGSTVQLPNSALSSDDLAQFNAGQLDHACFKCPVTTVVLTANSPSAAIVDADKDTYPVTGFDGAPGDCNDSNPLIHPYAVETVCDTIDKNCDGVVPPGVATLAGASSAAEWNTVWCNLACAQITPEVPGNAYDENCDGIVSDADNDGYFNVADPLFVAAVALDPNTAADCDDQNPQVHPGLQEIAGNSVDEDCDGYVVDADNDSYIAPSQASVSVANVYGLAPLANPNLRYRDCDDWNGGINPSETNLVGESVFASYYDPNTQARSAAMCAFVDADGGLNALGQGLLVDVNCDGLYSDLDGDGYTIAGDESLGVGNDIDCDDLDPRLVTQVPCVLPAATVALDGGNCTTKLQGSRPCNAGYVWSPAINNCADINECVLGTDTCNPNQICVNTLGAYVCPALVSPLVAGGMTLTVIVPNAIHVAFQPATGVDPNDALTYSIYTVVGAFSAATTSAVQNEGTVAMTVDNSNDVDITGLVGNANYQVAIVVQDSETDTALYLPQSITTTAPPYQTAFVVYTANGNLGGIIGADGLCNANNPNTVASSKALLVDGTTRVACTSVNCQTGGGSEHVDWPLEPNTQVLRVDSTLITTTDPNGLFSYPLTNGIAVNGAWYTGVSPNWVRNYTNCNNWTDGTSANQANVGSFADLTPGGLAENYYTCDQQNVGLVCISQ